MLFRSRLQVLHGVQKAALEHTGAAAFAHDSHAPLPVLVALATAATVEPTGLAQQPAPLTLLQNLLGLGDDVTAGLGQSIVW